MRLLRRKEMPKPSKRTTMVSFTAEDLADMARFLGVGKAMLQTNPPIIARLKAAMTRLGVSTKGF